MIDPLVILIIAGAFFLQSVFGFGGGLISIPLLSLIVGVKTAVTLVLMFQMCSCVLLFAIWKEVNWKFVFRCSPWLIGGAAIGVKALSGLADEPLIWCLVFAIILYLIRAVFFPNSKLGIKNHHVLSALGGGLGGIFQGMLGTGGPPLVMAISEAKLPKSEMRATLTALFFIMNIVRISLSSVTGLVTDEIVRMTLIILPFFLLGIYLGHKVHYRVKEEYYRHAVNLILLGSVVSLVFKAL